MEFGKYSSLVQDNLSQLLNETNLNHITPEKVVSVAFVQSVSKVL
jgi:hypothetical protein